MKRRGKSHIAIALAVLTPVIILAVVLVVVLGLASTSQHAETPSGVVARFFERINAKDESGAYACVTDQRKFEWQVGSMISSVELGGKIEINIVSENIRDNTAAVKVEIFSNVYGYKLKIMSMIYDLIRENNRWYISDSRLPD
jgi:hypothetical protein